MPTNLRHRHDVVIVGARPAGAAAALLLARLGHDVVVVERAQFPSDTVSTHQIARSGVVQLQRWGLLDNVLAAGTPPIRQVMFTTGDESVTRAVRDKHGVDCLVAPRRQVLDSIVADAAERDGADIRYGWTAAGVRLDDSGRATGIRGYDQAGNAVEIDARFVVGADGLRSRVAASVGADIVEDRGARGATQYAYFTGLPWPGIEFFAEEQSFAGVFPTNNGEACIWVCTPSASAHEARRRAHSRTEAFTDLLHRAAPTLVARLAAGRRTSPVRGMLRAPNHIRRAVGAGWALVGDAGYHHDAITGHGISDAFRDAELLAVSLDRALGGDTSDRSALDAYEDQRNAALRDIFDLTCAMAAYPPLSEFVSLQRQISVAIETEAAALAARPVPGEHRLACR